MRWRWMADQRTKNGSSQAQRCAVRGFGALRSPVQNRLSRLRSRSSCRASVAHWLNASQRETISCSVAACARQTQARPPSFVLSRCRCCCCSALHGGSLSHPRRPPAACRNPTGGPRPVLSDCHALHADSVKLRPTANRCNGQFVGTSGSAAADAADAATATAAPQTIGFGQTNVCFTRADLSLRVWRIVWLHCQPANPSD